MQIEEESLNSISIFKLNGRFDSYGAALFDQRVAARREYGKTLIVDLREVSFLSSIGIRSLLKIEKELTKESGGLILAAPAPSTLQVLSHAGLADKLKITESLEGAVEKAQRMGEVTRSSEAHVVDGRSYSVGRLAEEAVFLESWGASGLPYGRQNIEPQDLIAVEARDLQLAFGVGGFGRDPEQAVEGLGEFLSVSGVTGVIPADGHCVADFMLSQEASPQPVYIANAMGISGSPSFLMQETSGVDLSVGEFLEDLFRAFPDFRIGDLGMLGVVMLAEATEVMGSCFRSRQDISLNRLQEIRATESDWIVAVGVAGLSHLALKSDPTSASFREQLKLHSAKGDLCFHGHAILTTRHEPVDEQLTDLEEHLKKALSLDVLRHVAHLGVDTRLKNIKAWVYLPTAVRSGQEKLLKIELTAGTELLSEWEAVLRRIYTDSHRVVLTPIHGGYMSKTFHVSSFDRGGRKMLPTVLKIGPLALTRREEQAHRDCVLKYILNNATTIMGSAACGEWAGLRYNFVGISGAESRLSWLTDQYRLRSCDDLIAIFDRIFTKILKPWYGQPKWETVCPYDEHDPNRLFPNIVENAAGQLKMGTEEPTIFCRELGAALPNPYWFLQYEYPKRKARSISWYRSVTHGDLNMQNILLDEKDNIFVIDFSETRERNVIADFARLECILRFEMVRLENENNLGSLVDFIAGLTEPSALDEMPPLRYDGDDPLVDKAYRLICRLRKYADKVTLFEENIEPYLIALLEWTYPVVCYGSVNSLVKRLSAYSAALTCGKLLELESRNLR